MTFKPPEEHEFHPAADSGFVLRIVGSPPIAAIGYAMERLRCDTCGEVFTAPVPAEAGQEKYAPSVAVTIAVLRYRYRAAALPVGPAPAELGRAAAGVDPVGSHGAARRAGPTDLRGIGRAGGQLASAAP